MRVFPLVAVGLLLLAAGCTSPAQDPTPTGGPVQGLVAVQDRHSLPFNVTGYYSHTLVAGPYAMQAPQSVFVPVTLPATSGGAAVLNAGGNGLEAPRVHLGLFLPEVPEGTKVPVIADIGPYYGDSDAAATDPNTHRLGGFLIDNFVPHGYAVAQVSVFGTGLSNHCMDLMGLDEQRGVDAAVTWLGAQDWSNGNVGLIGRSYDGSTPWEAATTGNPHLKTIVPISGLTGMYELMWRNGTSETRGPIMHNVVYGTFGIDGQPDPGNPEQPADMTELVENTQTACVDYLQGPVQGAGAVATGSNLDVAPNNYWTDRYFFERALQNYNGSVYMIHGLQDWNVKPHVVLPRYAEMQAKWETKGLFGQWNHMYPDRPSEHVSTPPGEGHEAYPKTVRYDWAQDLLEWFDHYLMGTGPKPQLHTEVQDNMGNWRIVTGTYPAPAKWVPMALGAELKQTSPGSPLVGPGTDATGGSTGQGIVTFASEPLAAETRISGLAQLHVQVTPLGSGGQLYAELRDLDAPSGGLRLGHAVMDLRYAAGKGTGTTDAQPVAAGVPITARMEFEAMEVLVPAGHRLGLFLSATGREYLPSTTSAPVLVNVGPASVLKLPTFAVDADLAFDPPAWSGKAEATAPQP